MTIDWTKEYERYKQMFKGERFPLAFVDLDKFDRNIAYVASTQKETGKTIRVASKSLRCLDIDMSYRPLGRQFHIGVRRSPLHSPDQALDLARASRDMAGICIQGVMAYEAQIASVNDNYPAQWIKNRLLRFVKHQSIKELTQRRGKIIDQLRAEGHSLSVVNGGGRAAYRAHNLVLAGGAIGNARLLLNSGFGKKLPHFACIEVCTRDTNPGQIGD